MPRTSTFPLYDQIAGGTLRDELTDLRGQGLSYLEVAFQLREKHGFKLGPEMVRRWCAQLEIEAPVA